MLTISIAIAPSGQAATQAGAIAVRQPVVAHVALADHAALGVVLRHAVGAVPGAVLAADAGIGAVHDHAGDWIFCIRLDRAADQARGLHAVIAAHREIVALRVRVVPAFDFADAPPVDARGIAVLLVARHHAALAADALRHIEVKAILLTGSGLRAGMSWSGVVRIRISDFAVGRYSKSLSKSGRVALMQLPLRAQ